MHQLVIKVLNIIDARCNHEVYIRVVRYKSYTLVWLLIQSLD